MKAKTKAVQLGRRRCGSAVQVLRTDEHLEIWRCEDGARRSLTGTVNVALVTDALRHGQDLIEELVERTLKEIERESSAGMLPNP